MSTNWYRKSPQNRATRYDEDRDEQDKTIAVDVNEFTDRVTGEEDEDNFDFAKKHGLKAQWHCAHCGSNAMEIFNKSMLSFDNFYYNDDVLTEVTYSKPWTSSTKGKPKSKDKNSGELTTADSDDFIANGKAKEDNPVIAQCHKCYTRYNEKDIGKLTRFITKHGNITNVETVDMAQHLIAYPPDPDDHSNDGKPELKGAFKDFEHILTSYTEHYPASNSTKSYSKKDGNLTDDRTRSHHHDTPIHYSTSYARNENKRKTQVKEEQATGRTRKAPRPTILDDDNK